MAGSAAVAVLGVLLLALVAVPAMGQQQHAFEPIREELARIDALLREQDGADRAEVDAQIADVATRLARQTTEMKMLQSKYDSVKQDAEFLKTRADMSSLVTGALKQERSMLEKENATLRAECNDISAAEASMSQAHAERVAQLQDLANVLAHSAAHSSHALLEVEQSTRKFEQALQLTDMLQQDAVTAEAHADELQRLQQEIAELVQKLQEDHSMESLCVLHHAFIASRVAAINDAIDNVTSTATQWRLQADELNRQLLATDPLLAQHREAVAHSKEIIETIANAYQARRNSRVNQLCETVALRREVTPESSKTPILPAVLPGPSRHASATIAAVVDAELNCSEPMHTPPPPPRAVEPAPHRELSLGGHQPLPSKWADQADDKPCVSEPRVVDANALE